MAGVSPSSGAAVDLGAWTRIDALRRRLGEGLAIPAHPLALDPSRRYDPRRQRALTRYYLDAGAGGLAVGVHTTQFAIRAAGLYEPVLRDAIDAARHWRRAAPAPVMVAGVCGGLAQAVAEARLAAGLGYHAGLLSLAALKGAGDDALIDHCEAVACEIPLIGFYLQPAVGGLDLGPGFWARFAAIAKVVAIKVAPFNRYRTLDVVRGVVGARAEERVVLYTGNDDHIVLDLVTPFVAMRDGAPVTLRFRGGLLGHWSVGTRAAVELLERCKAAVAASEAGGAIPAELLALDSRVTDCNSAFFDVAHDFRGCIAGCHEVLRRQGLLEGTWCLDPEEGLSEGQGQEIERVLKQHPDLGDEAFVAAHLERWLDEPGS
ncbi:MAG: dihydrodipicolinate synthase family protein [Caldimonas sp.]